MMNWLSMESSNFERWLDQLCGITAEMADDEWDEIDEYQLAKWRESGYLEWLVTQ